MEYIYAALTIHRAGGKIDESSIKKVLEAAGAKPDDARVRALVAALKDVDIEKAIKEAAMPMAQPAQAAAAPAADKSAEKKKEDEKKSEDAAAAGLGALFGIVFV